MKAIILARVSTEEQKEAGNSLPAQQARLLNYIKNKPKLKLSKQFIFDESAYKEHRKKFDKIIEYIKQQKETIAFCCDKVDRLSRDFLIGLPALEKLRRDGNIELHFPSDNLILHKESPATDLFHFNIAVSLAQYYSNAIRDSVKRANESKVKRGEWPGKAPFGYKNIGTQKGDKDIVVDESRAPFVVKIFKMYAFENKSVAIIAKELKKMGVRSNTKHNVFLHKSAVYNILKNPFYYGIMNFKDTLYPHKYPTLIDEELFDKAQDKMSGYAKKPFKYASKPFIFRGLIKCADCGCMISPQLKKGKYIYYSCTNYKKAHKKVYYLAESDILEPILKVLKSLQELPDFTIKELVADLKNINEAKNEFHRDTITRLRAEYDKLDKRMSRMYDDKADESITEDFYNKKFKEATERQYEIQDELQKYTNANEKFYITANKVLSVIKRSYDSFINGTIEEQRGLLNFLFQNCQLSGRNITATLKKPLNAVHEYTQAVSATSEPQNLAKLNRKAETSASACSIWLPI